MAQPSYYMVSFTFFIQSDEDTMGRETVYFAQDGKYFDLSVFSSWVRESFGNKHGEFNCYIDFMRQVSEAEYLLNVELQQNTEKHNLAN